jgi:hypothetical protein
MVRNRRIADLRQRTSELEDHTQLRPSCRTAIRDAVRELEDDELDKVQGGTERPYRDYCVVV